MLTGLCDERLVGLDLAELSPPCDNGTTAALGARMLFEAMCAAEAARSKSEGK
ncbi:arginase family protein [[Eubacterium] cellulosolvens]